VFVRVRLRAWVLARLFQTVSGRLLGRDLGGWPFFVFCGSEFLGVLFGPGLCLGIGRPLPAKPCGCPNRDEIVLFGALFLRRFLDVFLWECLRSFLFFFFSFSFICIFLFSPVLYNNLV